ncbi:ribosomal RNA small subunit methyltransferase A [Parabacteroides johnsonii CL02T12C29]|uniref:Ribosomal RNA small subunit methyltransferase A n=2 Tax=Parabacteroides johnsonii TaxID=387661 RepID=K5Z370_9BACT|nr:ribosomal RNA small subunit methyltransferase A [Parabacteroides johnsonii CL02T12C29]
MTLNYLLYFCTPAKISIIFKYKHITPKKWMRLVKPKKALGQHFLKDLQIAERIADTLSDYKQLPVLEIGPGMGVLTQFLLEKGHDLTVVELDMESVDYLEQNFPALEGKILAEDFLRLDLSKLFPDQFCVIGNYPYNISSQIFFKVLDYKEHIPCCSGMIQKEVAERLAAGPGSKTYGILSVLLQAWYEVEYLFTVSEKVFDPPPKVKSAVIRMVRNNRKSLGCDEKLFKTVVKTSFNQRRKTLRNSMKPLLGKDCPDYPLPIFDKRPEQLSVEQFVELTLITERNLNDL